MRMTGLRCLACGDPTSVGHPGAAGYAIFCELCYFIFRAGRG
jgi:hypothetical protein